MQCQRRPARCGRFNGLYGAAAVPGNARLVDLGQSSLIVVAGAAAGGGTPRAASAAGFQKYVASAAHGCDETAGVSMSVGDEGQPVTALAGLPPVVDRHFAG